MSISLVQTLEEQHTVNGAKSQIKPPIMGVASRACTSLRNLVTNEFVWVYDNQQPTVPACYFFDSQRRLLELSFIKPIFVLAIPEVENDV